MRLKSGIRIVPDWPETGKMTKTSQFSDMTSLIIFSDVSMFLLSSLVTGPHLSIITGFRVMTIFVYKRLTRNPKLGNTPVCALLNIWKLEQVRDTEFGTDVSNERLLNAEKCQGYIFCRFWVIKGTSKGGCFLPPPQIRVKKSKIC